MRTEILYQPAYSITRVDLEPNEQIRVEGGAMVSMDPHIRVETAATGGIFRSIKRAALGGESFFMTTYSADASGGQVMLAASLPGDMAVFQLRGEEMKVQSGSFVGASMSIEVDTSWGGGRTFFGGEGLFMLRCSGSGTLIVASYGAIHHVPLATGQTYTVDTGHLVAFSQTVDFNVRRVAGWKSTLFSGEGLVVDVTGPGDLYLQTRSQDSFLSWLIPQLPNRSN
jgi:uncharacterized protein (TIGR00266 family)